MVRTIREVELPKKECYNCTHFSMSDYAYKWGECSNSSKKKRIYNEICSNWRKSEGIPHRYDGRIILWDFSLTGSAQSYYYSYVFARELVLIRDKRICQKCNKKIETKQEYLSKGEEKEMSIYDIVRYMNHKEKYEIHHIIPKSQGGSDHLRNLILLCLKCHNRTKRSSYLHRYKWVGIDMAQQKIEREVLR